MKNFYIIMNWDKEDARDMEQAIGTYLTAHGCSYKTSEGEFHKGRRFTDVADVPEGTDCIITLGGDGTFIQAARDLAGTEIPLIGINLGTLGYLTQMSGDGDIEEFLGHLLADRYQIQERMMLMGRAYHEGRQVTENIALNDIVLSRDGDLRVLKFKLYVDGKFLYEYSADGMIVATPTGSTAYNLSAGGPIAQPDGELLILTPICPHTLTSRTIVLGPDSRVRIEISMKNQGSQVISFDGDTGVSMVAGDYIEIERAKMVTRAVRLDDRSFLDILKHKMYDA